METDPTFRPVPRDELIGVIARALQFDGRRRVDHAAPVMAYDTARLLTEHLMGEFEVMKTPPAPAPGVNIHKISAAAECAATLAAPLASFADLILAIDCGESRCLGLRSLSVSSMTGGGYRLTVGETLARMRCRKCGKPPAEAVLRSFPGAEPERRLVLVGPRAFG